MHLRVRPLLVLIELFLLVIVQDGADSFVGLVALGPHFGVALFARQMFVLRELFRCVMQLLHNGFDLDLLLAREAKLFG